MIDEEVPADLRARMDVDRGQETRQVIDEAREEEQPRFEQPVRDAVHTDREQPRIEQNFPARPRRWVARLDRIEIGDQPVEHIMSPATRSEEHTSELQSLMRISYAVFCLKK